MKRWLISAAKVGFATGILYYIFSIVPFAQVLQSIRVAQTLPILGALALAVLAVYISASRLKALTDVQGVSLSLSRIAQVNFIAGFYGLALPGSLAAGAIRWHRLSEVGTKTDVLRAIVYARLIYMTALVAVGILFLSIELPRQVGTRALLVLLVLLSALSVVFYAAITARFGYPGPGRNGSGLVSRLLLAVRYRGLPGTKLIGVVALALLENLVGIVSVYLLVRSLDIEVGFVSIAWIRTVIQILTTIPISVSGLGIREGGLMVLLEPYGVTSFAAVALAFLMLSRGVLVGAIGGLLEAHHLLSRSDTRA